MSFQQETNNTFFSCKKEPMECGEFCCSLTKSNWKLFRKFKLETRSLAREGRTRRSGRRSDLDTMYNTLRWVENFDKTHNEGCNKQMNIILGTPMGWPLVETTHGY